MDELKEAAQSLKQTYQTPTTPDSTKEQSVKTDSTEPSPSDLAALAEADEVNDDANRHKPVAESVTKTEVPVTQPVTLEKKTTDQVNGEH